MVNLKLGYLAYKLDVIQSLCIKVADKLYKKKLGFKSKDMRIIRLIHLMPGITAKEIGSIMLLDKTLLSKILNVFEKKELIKRTSDRKDTRLQKITLSKKGEELYNKSMDVGSSLEQEMFDTFDTKKWNELNRSLDFAIDALSKYSEEKRTQKLKFKPIGKSIN